MPCHGLCGTAGVGRQLLRLHAPERVPPVLMVRPTVAPPRG